MSGKPPRYRRYRGSSSRETGPADDPLKELRALRRADSSRPAAPEQGAPGGRGRAGRGTDVADPPARRPRSAAGRAAEKPAASRAQPERAPLKPRRALPPARSVGRRVLKWFVVWALAWSMLSLLVFLVSAQLHQADVGSGGESVLGGGGTPPVGVSTILVIGSDRRPKDSKEPGASTSGYGLADSIMLLRVGGGKTSKLSIARDTLVPIEGHGVTKINSAYAYGGPELLVKTVESYTGVNVDHIMQISFGSFPDLIDAMGGITYKGSCVISKISGGYANGGVTLRIRSGEKVHLDGMQALALARTRKNRCNPNRETDLTRAHRQQRVLASMKRRALSPIGFVRLPLIAWEAPKTLDSDMAGPRLISAMSGLALSTGGKTSVLGTESGVVPDAMKQKLVRDFEAS